MKKAVLTFITLCILAGCARSVTHLEHWRGCRASEDIQELYNDVAIPSHPLTLDEIIDIGLNRNLTLLVKAQECAVQRELATAEKLNMIPSLIANIEWNERNNNPGSSSQSLDPAIPPAPPSVSSRKESWKGNITFTWNMIDFGLSYFRSRQEANMILINRLEYERLQQNLILDLVRQYWNAVVALQGIKAAKELIDKTEEQKARLEEKIERRVISKNRGLRLADELVQIQLDLQIFQKDYDFAISELNQLMGIPPAVSFEIDAYPKMEITAALPDVMELEDLAIRNRPELYTHDIQEVIDADEVRAELLQLIPGVSLIRSLYYDDNPFLIKQNWLLVGMNTSWYLLDIPNHYSRAKAASYQKSVTRRNRLVLSMGAISQVHLAYSLYHDDLKHYRLVEEKELIKEQLLMVDILQRKLGKIDDADLIHIEMNALSARLEKVRTYADMQVSLEQLNNSIGIPCLFSSGSR